MGTGTLKNKLYRHTSAPEIRNQNLDRYRIKSKIANAKSAKEDQLVETKLGYKFKSKV